MTKPFSKLVKKVPLGQRFEPKQDEPQKKDEPQKRDEPPALLVYDRPLLPYDRSETGGRVFVEPTAHSIRAAEDMGWVASNPETLKRRAAILDAEQHE